MSSYLAQFSWANQYTALVDHLESLPIWYDMINTVEDSPWHREENVAVHTTMVVSKAIDFAEEHHLSSRDTKLIMLSTLFHDFGKPAAMEIKYDDEYPDRMWRSFYGHEKVSARWFEGFFVDNYNQLFEGWVDPEEAYIVTFLIEHHLPYKITDDRKRVMYGVALSKMLDSREAYYAAIKADCWGRISDDHPKKKQATLDWIDEFEKMCVEKIDNTGRTTAFNHRTPLTEESPVAVFLVGPSGAGKSTTSKELIAKGYEHYSWDEYRLQFLDMHHPEAKYVDIFDRTQKAFLLSVEKEKEFSSYVENAFIALVKSGKNIVVDNTNLTRKRRAHLLQLAQSKGYKVVARYKQCSPTILQERAVTRPDKRLKPSDVVLQYKAVDVPIPGEFDQVIIDSTNYTK